MQYQFIGFAGIQCPGGLREQWGQQTIVLKQAIGCLAVAGGEQFEDFIEQPGRRDVRQQWGQLPNGGLRFRLNLEVQFGRKTNGAQHSHGIFPIAGFRVANQADLTVFQILHAVGKVDNGEIPDAVIQRIDGEVAPKCVFFLIAIDIIPQ